MDETTYDVRIYALDVYRGAKVTTYWVRWKCGGQKFAEPFRHYVAERHALYSAIIDTRDRDLALIAQHNTSSPTRAALASPRPAP